MKGIRLIETDVAKRIISYLADLRWEVFQEVTGEEGRADIVARQNSVVWIVEVKTSFGLPVIEQAKRWVPHAHRVSVAIPSYPNRFGQEVCRYFGIGILWADHRGKHGGSDVTEELWPRLNRKPFNVPMLCEEHKTYAEAGTNGGGYFTPFRRTIRFIEEELRKSPKIKMKDLIDRIDHHYSSDSSARIHLAKWITDGHIPGYGIKQEGRNNIVVPIDKI